MADEDAAPDDRLERRQQAATALAAIAATPNSLREPAILFFALHECSTSGHRHVPEAAEVATVNNRLPPRAQTETEDASYDDANAADAWVTR